MQPSEAGTRKDLVFHRIETLKYPVCWRFELLLLKNI